MKKQQHDRTEIFEAGSHLGITNFHNPFRAIVLILYPMKTPEAFWFPGVFKKYKMSTLARNGSI